MTDTPRHATLHRMVLPDHICPFGLKALELLQREGFDVDDRPLTSREETDAFKAEHGLDTTPLIIIDGKPVGGYDDLKRYLDGQART